MANTDVLIVGAGPTGLILALTLHKLGVNFRIIDQAMRPGERSRAIAIQSRTLEFYDQLGFAHGILSASLKLKQPALYLHGKRRAAIPLGNFGKGISPHPYIV